MIVSLSFQELQVLVTQKINKVCLLGSGRHESIFGLVHILIGKGLLDGLTYQGQKLPEGLLPSSLLSDLLDV